MHSQLTKLMIARVKWGMGFGVLVFICEHRSHSLRVFYFIFSFRRRTVHSPFMDAILCVTPELWAKRMKQYSLELKRLVDLVVVVVLAVDQDAL